MTQETSFEQIQSISAEYEDENSEIYKNLDKIKLNPGVNLPKNHDADISHIMKIDFNTGDNINNNFEINMPKLSKISATKLAKAFYNSKELDSTFIKSKSQTSETFTKPVNCKIEFEKDYSFNYLNYLDGNTSKLLSCILSLYKSKNFIVNDQSTVYEGMMDTSKFYQALGLYSIHDVSCSDEFITITNKFITETIKRIFNYKSSNSTITDFKTSALTDEEYYKLFKNIFIDASSGKLKSWAVSSLLLSSMINNITSSNIYDHIPKIDEGIYINNFEDLTTNNYNSSAVTFGGYISSDILFYPQHLNDAKPEFNLWNYPLMNVTISTDGVLKIIGEKLSSISSNILQTSSGKGYIYFDKGLTYDVYKDFNIDEKTLLKAPDQKSISDNNKKDIYTLSDIEIKFVNVGKIYINEDNQGNYCSGCKKRTGGGHGSESFVKPYYKLKIGDKYFDLWEITEEGYTQIDYTSGDGWGDRTGVRFEDTVNNKKRAYSVNQGIASHPKFSIDRGSKGYTCCKRNHNERYLSAIVYNNYKQVFQWIVDNPTKFNEKFGINFVFADKLEKRQQSRRYYTNTISAFNEDFKLARPKLINKENVTYKLGNNISDSEKETIKKLGAYQKSGKNGSNSTKNYFATFGQLANDIYKIDDRFYYILYSYLEINYVNMCKLLESEIYDALLSKPELLLPYRIQQGYLSYAVKKIGDGNIWMNMECPIIGTMLHSDTTNVTEYNDYLALSELTADKVKIVQTTDGNIITYVNNENSEESKATIDKIYSELFKSFGNIKSETLSTPGIYINDSGNPLDYICRESDKITPPMKIVSVDVVDPQGTYSELSQIQDGSLLMFGIDKLIPEGVYSTNSKLNASLTNANGEVISKSLFFPYTCLVHDVKTDSNGAETGVIKNIFMYASTNGIGNVGSIANIVYFCQPDNTLEVKDGKTYLSYSHSTDADKQIFRFVKNYCGIFEKTTPFGRLRANNVVNL